MSTPTTSTAPEPPARTTTLARFLRLAAKACTEAAQIIEDQA